MKIEKISNTQIKFLLTQADLDARNIQFFELSNNSEKAKDLFRDIMAQAVETCDFSVENSPLMIEAVPIGDSIMIIVSKVMDVEDVQNNFTLIPPSKVERKFIKKKPSIEFVPIPMDESNLSIYSFASLDIASSVSQRLLNFYDGDSQLYKFNNEYYLIIQSDSLVNISAEDADSIALEYGHKHISCVVSKAYLDERGEVLIKTNAVSVLANL